MDCILQANTKSSPIDLFRGCVRIAVVGAVVQNFEQYIFSK